MHGLVLICERGGRAGTRVPLDGEVTLGRAPGVDVQLDPVVDPLVSSHHARVLLRNGTFHLLDLGSTNGTYVFHAGAWRRLEGEYPLAVGSRFALGREGPIFALANAAGGTAVADVPVSADVPMGGLDAVTGPPEPSHNEPRVETRGGSGVLSALMTAEVARSTRGTRWGLLVLGVLLVGGAITVGLLLRGQQDAQEAQVREAAASRAAFEARTEALQRDLDATRADLTSTQTRLAAAQEALDGAGAKVAGTATKLADVQLAMASAEGVARTRLEAQAQELTALKTRYEAELQRTQRDLEVLREKEDAAASIARRYESAVFMLIVVHPDNTLDGFCTAFAVDATGLLATNAHCVEACEQARSAGGRVVARMNKRPDKTWRVARWSKHPDYDGSAFSNDVGLVRLELSGKLPAVAPIASWVDVIGLAPGQPIYTLGFPGKVMNPDAPSADLRAAVVSRVTDFENSTSMPGSNRMVWHSALTTKGTSGSPIFDARGRVVAVNNGVLSARKIVVRDEAGRLAEDIGYDANGLNFGIRADALTELIERGL